MDPEHTDDDIVIGECLTKDEAEGIINNLVREVDLEDLLVDIQIRSDQHRQNYAALKTQHEKVLHQLKILESEIVKLETEKHDLETEVGDLVDKTVHETNELKREISFLESQIPTESSIREIEDRVKEEVESVWKSKITELTQENDRLNDALTNIQQVIKIIEHAFKVIFCSV